MCPRWLCPRCARGVPEVCPRCAPGGCARDVPQVCFVPEVCPRCAPGVPEIVPQVCPRCAPGVHRQITELPICQLFQTVGFFITQDEHHETIEICLKKILSWAPRWRPLVFLMDQDSAELLAVENVFPLVQIFLCDFHVKMAWQKKFKSLGGIILSAISFRVYTSCNYIVC